jgi:hypothetical protein
MFDLYEIVVSYCTYMSGVESNEAVYSSNLYGHIKRQGQGLNKLKHAWKSAHKG